MKIRHHQPIVICGPSGSGKSTLLRRLLSEFKDLFIFTVSHTTRQPRKGELNGREYHFVEKGEMMTMIEQNEFIEHTNFSGNFYGTSKRAVRDALQVGKHLIIEVDIEGVRALSSIKELQPVFIFIKPPSKAVLFERLSNRGSESPANLRLRLDRADQELAFADSGLVHFDLVLINDNLDDTYTRLKHFLAISLTTNPNAKTNDDQNIATSTSDAASGVVNKTNSNKNKTTTSTASPTIIKSQRPPQQHQIRVHH